MTRHGLGMLKANGFRPAGPWVVDVGRWSEVTYLFRFDSLAERERLIAKFSATAEARSFDARVGELVEEVTTRLLLPAPFSRKPPAAERRGEAGDVCRPCLIGSGLLRGFMRPALPTAIAPPTAAGSRWRRDPADRPASWNARARIPGPGRRNYRQARPDAGADQHPGRR